MTRRWPALAIGALSAAAVAVGLLMAGGPGHARKQARDAQREQDLTAMTVWIDCLARAEGTLPAEPAAHEQCPWDQRVADPYTGQPYRYEVTGPSLYRICAEFELPPQRPVDQWTRNAAGCLVREVEPGGANGAG